MLFSYKIKKLKQYIEEADKIVFFGGAGVSTESGVPDFRSKDGLYNQHDVQFEKYEPEYLLSSYCLYDDTKVFYEYYRQKFNLKNIEPNITHLKLAELEQKHDLTVVTQNLDGLHQKAGSKNVLEIHGTAAINYCRRCGKIYPADYIFTCPEEIPLCHACENEENEYCPKEKAYIRPKISLYGEFLPPAFQQAEQKIRTADLLIVGGTSLKVYPAAGLVSDFLNPIDQILTGNTKPKRLVIINKQPTNFDDQADLVFHTSLGKVFSKL